ncbi:hypothetical protein JCM11641_006429 [Rhodosporidiobolus odoratus]
MRLLPSGPESLLLAAFAAHVLLVPGTKVEESFTLHAVRDALVHGYKGDALPKWDHVEFAGAVPRSFIPPLSLAAISKPVLELASRLGVVRDGVDAQVAVRLVLSLVSALSVIFFSRRVAASYGSKVAKYSLLLLSTSFHVPFWAGRTVPNVLAFPLVQIAFALFVTPPALSSKIATPRRATRQTLATAFGLLTFAAVVVRLELVALLIPFASEHLLRGTVRWTELLRSVILAGGAGIALSVAIDTPLWLKPDWLWPEGQAAMFNVVQGKSADWGVSPVYFYLFPTLPRLLHLTLPFALFSLGTDRRTRRLLWPCIGFVVLMSSLKHKEWRFIAYTIPAFFVAASAGVVGLGAFTASSRLRRFAITSLLFLNLIFTFLGLAASQANYPGFEAIRALESHLLAASSPTTDNASLVKVWVGVEAKMKGASNFLLYDSPYSSHSDDTWYTPISQFAADSRLRIGYNKSESPLFTSPVSASNLLPALLEQGFDYAIVDSSAITAGARVVYQATEFGGIDWRGLATGKVRDWEGLVGGKRRPSVRVIKVAQD